MNKVILYIATSQDGFIADIEGGVDWLPHPKTKEDLDIMGYYELMNRIDSIAMGNRSYQQILTFGKWGWPDKQTYVFTSKPLSTELDCIRFTKDSPESFIKTRRKGKANKDIWLLGGAQLAQSFASSNLIDEVILTIIPTKLGAGIALDLPLDGFNLISEKSYKDGIVQKTYLRR